MTIYAVLLPNPQPQLDTKIVSEFGGDALRVTDTQWLISSGIATSEDIVKRLGVFDRSNPTGPSTGNAIVFSTSGYFGRAPTNVWEWLKVKLEAPPGVPNAKSA